MQMACTASVIMQTQGNGSFRHGLVLKMWKRGLLDASDSEEESVLLDNGELAAKAVSDTDSTACASEEESSDQDLDEAICCEPCGPAELPSKGSHLHASGQCKPCGFFIWDSCENGKDCGRCHEPHASRFSNVECDSDEESIEDGERDFDTDSVGSVSSRSFSLSSSDEEDESESSMMDAAPKTIASSAPLFAAMLLQQIGTPPGLELPFF